MTGLLKAASQNVKNGIASVKLFEVGSVFSPSREESLKMAFLFSGDTQKENLANAGKPQKVDLVLTGNYAKDEVIEAADLVTEMREIKHPFQRGIKAKKGIDF